MALVGYDPTKRETRPQPMRLRKSGLGLLDQTVVMSGGDVAQFQPRCALRLIPLVGGGLARTYVVRAAETTLGRQMGADLRLWDSKVSRQHCKILISEHAATLVDLDSSNGTFVNEERIEERELRDGDLVRIGDTVLRVRYMDFAGQGAADDTYWLATRDPGSELYNRQYVLEAIRRELARAGRYKQIVTLVLLSLDRRSKPSRARLNVLDKEMRALGALIQREGGEDVLVGRYGGTEIVVLMPMYDGTEAEALCRAVSQKAEEASETDVGFKPPLFWGIATFPQIADSAEQLVERAEVALYEARNEGKAGK